MLIVPMICLGSIRNLKYLSPVSLLASICQCASLVIVLYYVCQGLPPVGSRPAFESWATLPLYFSTAVYAFLGISLILPLQNSMHRPQDFAGVTGVLNRGMLIVAVLDFAVGFLGYLKFGYDIKGNIILNLPSEDK